MTGVSINGELVRHFLKTKEFVIGAENRFKGTPNYYKYTDDEGGEALNYAIDYGARDIYLDTLLMIRDENVELVPGSHGLKFKGFGHPAVLDNPAVNLEAAADSGMWFDGHTIINNLGAWREGSVHIEKMTLAFTGINASVKPMIDSDYVHWQMDDILLQEWNNTFDNDNAVLGGLAGGITPDSTKTVFRDVSYHTKSADSIGWRNHNENINHVRPFMSFQWEDQVGISCVGVGCHSVIDPLLWFGSGAHAVEVFRVLNLGKDWNFYNVSGSHQFGGLDEECSLFSEESGLGDGLDLPIKVNNLRGDFEWKIKSEADDLAIWKDDPTQLCTDLRGSWEGTPLPGGMREQLYFDYSPGYTTPNVVYTPRSANAVNPIVLTGVQHARFWGIVQASDAVDNHGVCAYNVTDGSILCEYEWDQQAGVQQIVISPWTPVRITGTKVIDYRRKGGDAADQILEKVVGVELR